MREETRLAALGFLEAREVLLVEGNLELNKKIRAIIAAWLNPNDHRS